MLDSRGKLQNVKAKNWCVKDFPKTWDYRALKVGKWLRLGQFSSNGRRIFANKILKEIYVTRQGSKINSKLILISFSKKELTKQPYFLKKKTDELLSKVTYWCSVEILSFLSELQKSDCKNEEPKLIRISMKKSQYWKKLPQHENGGVLVV